MSPPRPEDSRPVLLVSAKDAMAVDTDLPLLTAALKARGIASHVVAWDDPACDFDHAPLVVVRSAWDYVPRRDEFIAWAERVRAPLLNDARTLRWNTDKRYLRDLEREGVAIVPTTWIEAGATGETVAATMLPDADEIVVKPAISAGARDTARYPRSAIAEARAHVARLAGTGVTVMVQPYVDSVDARGETGMLHFGGVYSHAIEKGAILRGTRKEVAGLFAEERIAPRDASPAERGFALKVLAAAARLGYAAPLYARVDVVDDGGTLRLLELELCEPSVFLDVDVGAAARFAEAIEARLVRRT